MAAIPWPTPLSSESLPLGVTSSGAWYSWWRSRYSVVGTTCLEIAGLALGATLMVLAGHAVAVEPTIGRGAEVPPNLGKGRSYTSTVRSEPRLASRVVSVPELHWAAVAGDLNHVQRLLDAGASVTSTETLWGGELPLHWAAYGGNPNVVRALLRAGAPIEAQDDSGETAVREALRSDHAGFLTLQALLIAGASPEARSNSAFTALHEAVELASDHGPTAVLLLRMFGADPNSSLGDSGVTPLHLAALQPFERFSGAYLIDATRDPNGRAADVNIRDNNGSTPLHWLVWPTASARDPRVAEWLILNGADVNAVDTLGQTPRDWAEIRGAEELVTLFDLFEESM